MSMTLKISVLATAAALALVTFVALGPAEAAGINERISGNFVDTAIDTNDDGMQANYWSGQARGNGGPSYEGLVEIMFAPTGLCPAGNVEGEVVEYSIVRRYNNGDLAYSRLVDGILCFDPAAGVASLTINAEFTGGTGRYANASGTYTAEFDVTLLVPDPMGGIAHGSFTGSTSG